MRTEIDNPQYRSGPPNFPPAGNDYDNFDSPGTDPNVQVKGKSPENQGGQVTGKGGISSSERAMALYEMAQAMGAILKLVNGGNTAPVDKPEEAVGGADGVNSGKDAMELLYDMMEKIAKGLPDPNGTAPGPKSARVGPNMKPDTGDPQDLNSATAAKEQVEEAKKKLEYLAEEYEGVALSLDGEEPLQPAAPGAGRGAAASGRGGRAVNGSGEVPGPSGQTMGSTMKRLARLMASMATNMAEMQQALDLNSLEMAKHARDTQIQASELKKEAADYKQQADRMLAVGKVLSGISGAVGEAGGAVGGPAGTVVHGFFETLGTAVIEGSTQYMAAGKNFEASMAHAEAEAMQADAGYVDKLGQSSSSSANRMAQAINSLLQNFRSFVDTVNSGTMAISQNLK